MAKEAVTGAAALEAARREKMRRLEELGIDPWGQRYDGAMPIAEIRARESEIIEVPSQEEGKPAEYHWYLMDYKKFQKVLDNMKNV